jgi:hypothetical protein
VIRVVQLGNEKDLTSGWTEKKYPSELAEPALFSLSYGKHPQVKSVVVDHPGSDQKNDLIRSRGIRSGKMGGIDTK